MPKHDEPGIKPSRRKGSDKAKRTHERNGGFSTKHLRLKAQELDNRTKPKTA